MKLTRFIGTGVRGYLNFDIQFNEDVNFLIGDNGCGKTTVLRLLKGLLVPSVYELCEIEYEKVEVDLIDDDKQTFTIKSSYENKKINLSISQDNKSIKNGSFPIAEIRFYKENGIESPLLNEDNNVIDVIKNKIKNPIIIYTSRLVAEQLHSDVMYRKGMSVRGQIVYPNVKQMHSTSIRIALNEIKTKVIDTVRFNSDKKNKIENQFRAKLVPLLLNTKVQNQQTDFKRELDKLEKYSSTLRNASITKFLGDSFCKVFKKLFDGVKYNLQIVNSSQKSTEDSVQFWDDISEKLYQCYGVIDQAEKFVTEIDKLMLPIDRFQNSINTFFKKSGKKLVITGAGDIIINVLQTQKNNNIFELSSGEQQLIILLGHLAFDQYEIFMVDEPELSLHLKWQNEFIDALKEANPNAQYIMATHAPAIVGDLDKKCILL